MSLVDSSRVQARPAFYHGVRNRSFPTKDSLDYHQRMTAANSGESKVRDWSRAFLVPGMGHCSGGVAAIETFEMLTASVDWVVKGIHAGTSPAIGRAFPGRGRYLLASHSATRCLLYKIRWKAG